MSGSDAAGRLPQLKARRTHLLELIAGLQRELGHVDVQIYQLERLDQPGPGTAPPPKSQQGIEERRQLAHRLLAIQPMRFMELLRALQEHSPGLTKNHVTTILKDERFKKLPDRRYEAVAERR